MKVVDKYLDKLDEQKVKIPVEHPGVLEVPEGKNVEDLPMTHFQDLIKKKGWAEISKALTNLHTWNVKQNPTLSSWANGMQEKLAKWVEGQREKGELKEQKVKIPVEHPGVLEVPEGKNVEDLPMSHFQDLIKKKGWGEISRALTNLHTWNRDRNKPLSSWANGMQEKLAKWVESQREKGELKEDVKTATYSYVDLLKEQAKRQLKRPR